MENLYLIVGLGNPGADYARTRHNAGFLVADRLAERWRAGWAYEKKFNARLASAQRNERRALLCEPQTYMNSSGEAVGAVAAFYRVPFSALLVVVDDADLPLGEQRWAPWARVHRATFGHARLRPAAGGHRAAERGARNHRLRAGPI
jgi:PTH1 family peptidyl-tRNA hydrolase